MTTSRAERAAALDTWAETVDSDELRPADTGFTAASDAQQMQGRREISAIARTMPALVSAVALSLAAVLLAGMWRDALRYQAESMEALALVWAAVGSAFVAGSALFALVAWTGGRTSAKYASAAAVLASAAASARGVHAATHG